MDQSTERVIDSFDQIGAIIADERPCYVRHSRGYAVDVASASVDHESGLELPGLSANPLDPEPWWTRPWQDWVARQICQYEHLSSGSSDDVHTWLLTGRVVGRGPDCEPLLVDVRSLGRLSDRVIDEARRRYRERFAVGKATADD